MRKKLKQARIDKELTQKEVAEYLGLNIRAYKYIESGHTIGKMKTWDKLEELFNIDQKILREDETALESKELKIQTGLRLPENQYERIVKHADRVGVSINQFCLMLIDIGLNCFESPENHS